MDRNRRKMIEIDEDLFNLYKAEVKKRGLKIYKVTQELITKWLAEQKNAPKGK